MLQGCMWGFPVINVSSLSLGSDGCQVSFLSWGLSQLCPWWLLLLLWYLLLGLHLKDYGVRLCHWLLLFPSVHPTTLFKR